MSNWFITLLTLVALVRCSARPSYSGNGAISRLAVNGRPKWWQHALMARWLVHESNWATVATISDDFGGNPFGRVEDISDGPQANSTGRLLFYLANTQLTHDALTHPNVSVVMSEAALAGHCSYSSGAELPICAQVYIGGLLTRVPDDEVEEARELVFARFPSMANWPKSSHGFAVYELQPKIIRLVDFFGGAAFIDPKDYFAVESDDILGTRSSNAA